MQTIKLKYTTSDANLAIINQLRTDYSPITRVAYKRYMEGMPKTLVTHYLIKIFPNKDSWFLDSAVKDAEGMARVDKNQDRTRIFGGKENFIARSIGSITNAEYKEARLLPFSVVGEAPKHGNRKFKFDMENNQIIFKVSKNQHLELKLPKLKKNYKAILTQLEILASDKATPISFKLTDKEISITFNEEKLARPTKQIATRYAGIDLNPNYIGFVIYDSGKLIHNQMFKLNNLTKKSGLKSSDKKSKYLTNKRHHELHEVTKQIRKLCQHYQVAYFTLEQLNMKPGNKGKGKTFNRYVNNVWNRGLLKQSLLKHMKLAGIKAVEINPAYSSYIGNIVFNNLPDPLAAASEIARRGYEVITKKSKSIYPALPADPNTLNRWKEEMNWTACKTWKDICSVVKISGVKYRVPIAENCNWIDFKTRRSKVLYFTT